MFAKLNIDHFHVGKWVYPSTWSKIEKEFSNKVVAVQYAQTLGDVDGRKIRVYACSGEKIICPSRC